MIHSIMEHMMLGNLRPLVIDREETENKTSEVLLMNQSILIYIRFCIFLQVAGFESRNKWLLDSDLPIAFIT